MSELQLSPAEARVVAVLVEKSITTPQYYPMTVNGILLAANQKTSRHPVMSLSEGDVGNALNSLEERKLVVRDSFSARAQKWRHQFQHQMMLKPETQAVLVALMLRGAQTQAELRAHAEALNGPTDLDGVQAALADLADRAQPLVTELARAPGQSAARWAHLLCGEPAADAVAPASPRSAAAAAPANDEIVALRERVAALEARMAGLEAQLGIGPSPGDAG
ncbi:YceH family protein [Sinimarinibacterium flocculans]|uniref:YceH family protein n=1 Tax=Sinimarinibacterium flocculans TaxID=985250 RepID=UPI002491597B|nr:DUF480 domain-containing protein [Sinimarinibacterium flocculans]